MRSRRDMKRTLCLCSILSTLLLFFLSSPAGYAQFSDGVSGLLSMPSAEMHRDGTFTITNNFLNKHQLSKAWPSSIPVRRIRSTSSRVPLKPRTAQSTER